MVQETDKIEHLLERFKIKMNAETLFTHFIKTVEKQHEKLKKKGIDYPEIEIDKIWMCVIGSNNRKRARAFARPDSALKLTQIILDMIRKSKHKNQDVISSV